MGIEQAPNGDESSAFERTDIGRFTFDKPTVCHTSHEGVWVTLEKHGDSWQVAGQETDHDTTKLSEIAKRDLCEAATVAEKTLHEKLERYDEAKDMATERNEDILDPDGMPIDPDERPAEN